MNHMKDGLLYRVKRAARQIGEQHANLDEILRGFEPLLTRGDSAAVRELFQRYRGALDAHFSLEEGVFFPALHGLHPERSRELEELGAEHRGFLAKLEGLAGELDRDLVGFGRGLKAIAGEFAAHESREERVVRQLAAESPPSEE
jgi:hypothetical protein